MNYAYDLTKFDPTSDQEPPEDALVPLEMDPKAPFVGLAFKITETRFGQLTWMRVYQGALKKGQQVPLRRWCSSCLLLVLAVTRM